MDYTALPHLNAALNATSFLLLLAGFYFISRRNVGAHRACMLGALGAPYFSVSYLIYPFATGGLPLTGRARPLPLLSILLNPHRPRVVIVPPSLSHGRALRVDFAEHRRIAAGFPIWLYVPPLVAVYVMLYHYDFEV